MSKRIKRHQNDDEMITKCPRNEFIDYGSPLCCACGYNSGECEYQALVNECENEDEYNQHIHEDLQD